MFIKKNLSILILTTLLFFSLFGLCFAESPLSQDTKADLLGQEGAFADSAGFQALSIGNIVSTIITALLGLLGIIFVVLMIYAGFLWMTAHGNEEQVKKATSIIQTAVIGLIIVVAAYSITYFVFNALGGASGGGGGGGTSP